MARAFSKLKPIITQMTWQGTPNVTTDDIVFTSEILDQLESRYCIDTNRIYATGKSQGGGFVGVLACDAQMSRRIAAFAPVSGAFYQTEYGASCDPGTVAALAPCSPGRGDVPVLDFHGLKDATIAYRGGMRRGACLPAIPHWCQTWAERDGLSLVNTSSRVPGALGGSTAVRYEWGEGAQQGLVTHIMDGVVSTRGQTSALTGISGWVGGGRRDLLTRGLVAGRRTRLALDTAKPRQRDARTAPGEL